jgi:transcriptional regulator with XRE-family HTH domain
MHPIKKLRLKRKLTLEDAARELGISKPNLSRIENGRHGASDPLKRRIVEWSGGRISASDLLNYHHEAAA